MKISDVGLKVKSCSWSGMILLMLLSSCTSRDDHRHAGSAPSPDPTPKASMGAKAPSESLSKIEKHQWLLRLEQRMIHRHIGGGEFMVSLGQEGADRARHIQNHVEKMAMGALKNFEKYKMEWDDQKRIIKGIKYDKKMFSTWINDLYGLGLAWQLKGTDEVKVKAQKMLKWMMWNEIEYSDMDPWYLSTIGRAFFLLHDIMNAEELEYALDILYGEKNSAGKGRLEKSLHITEAGPQGDVDGFRSADMLRMGNEFALCAILMLPNQTDEEKERQYRDLMRLRKTLLYAALPSDGVRGFIKKDYTGSHHQYHYVSAYVPQAAQSLAGMATFLRATPWELTEREIEGLRGFSKELYFYAHLGRIPLGLTGRVRKQDMLESTYDLLPLVAVSRSRWDEDLLQLICDTYRDDLMRSYSPTYRLNQTGFPFNAWAISACLEEIKRRGMQPQKMLPQRVMTYPYAPGLAASKGLWKAHVKGMSKWFWTFEGGITASNPQAYFGTYKSHGALEIMSLDPEKPLSAPVLNPTNLNGMDMGHLPGTTVLYRDDEQMLKDVIESRTKPNTTAVGGVQLNETTGFFMMDMKNFPKHSKDVGLEAKKSYFFVGDTILLLGSDIGSSAQNQKEVHTTLFQNDLGKAEELSNHAFVIPQADNVLAQALPADFMDGLMSEPVTVQLEKDSFVMVDADQTGLYLPKGHEPLTLVRREQSWLDIAKGFQKAKTGNWKERRVNHALTAQKLKSYRGLGWINHGRHAKGGEYEAALRPMSNARDMQSFKAQQDQGLHYKVVQKNKQAHVVHFPKEQIWAYGCYEDVQNVENGPLQGCRIAEALPHLYEDVEAHPGYALLCEEKGRELDLALSFLDLRLRAGYRMLYGVSGEKSRADYPSAATIVEVVLRGHWKPKEQVSHLVNWQHEGSNTKLYIRCQHGLSFPLTLIKSS